MTKTAPLAALLAVLVAAQPAAASTTRVLSLGLDNWQLDDETNHWTNPALLRSAPDFGLFEMGTQPADNAALTAGSQWGGFHKSIGESAVFALYVRRPYQTNDFNASATSLPTPMPGGAIAAGGVNGVTGLDAAADTAGLWTTSGPFGTGTSALTITGSPTMTRNIALPQNYVDAIFAWAWGRMDWGVHFNYARNAGGQVRHDRFENSATAANPGFMELDRLSQEFNTRLGWRWNGFRNSWMHMVVDASLPDFDMEYAEGRASGGYANSYIRSEPMINTGGLFQFGHRNETESLWSVTLRGNITDTTAEAGIKGTGANGGALTTNRNGYWANVRKFIATDFTWVRPYDRYKSMLVASIGAEHTYIKQSFQFTDVLAGTSNHSDLARSRSLLFPIRVAIETTPWDLLAIRAGLQKNIFSESSTRLRDGDGSAPETLRETDVAIADPNGTADGVGLSFGVGIRLVDGLMWDTVVRQLLLFDGPNVVGGNTPGLFAQTTLVYRWGEENTLKRISKLKPMINLKNLFSKRSAD
ncbi:MAG: hypothetical protein HYZ75_19820 [Elusimicrobia bacterium]|nr:hypothetical protein [Elusimicrobiota bacterium]